MDEESTDITYFIEKQLNVNNNSSERKIISNNFCYVEFKNIESPLINNEVRNNLHTLKTDIEISNKIGNDKILQEYKFDIPANSKLQNLNVETNDNWDQFKVNKEL